MTIVERDIKINDYLRSEYGLEDETLLNAAEVEILCQMIVYHFIKKEQADLVREMVGLELPEIEPENKDIRLVAKWSSRVGHNLKRQEIIDIAKSKGINLT